MHTLDTQRTLSILSQTQHDAVCVMLDTYMNSAIPFAITVRKSSERIHHVSIRKNFSANGLPVFLFDLNEECLP